MVKVFSTLVKGLLILGTVITGALFGRPMVGLTPDAPRLGLEPALPVAGRFDVPRYDRPYARALFLADGPY